jgi:hypothetical protein
MVAHASRVANASNWLATFAYAYVAFVIAAKPVTTVARWVVALTEASVAYVLIMLALAAFWRHDSAHAAICCAGGMAIAVLCGGWVATTILLPAHRRAGLWTCTLLGALYPMLLVAGSAPDAPVHAMQSLYVIASTAGGIVALWALPIPRAASIAHGAHV